MALPAGITTCQVTAGTVFDFGGGDQYSTMIVATPLVNLTWAATGAHILGPKAPLVATSEPGMQAVLDLPHVDQPGFLQNGVPYTLWAYRIDIVWRRDGSAVDTKTINALQPVVGQTSIDLDMLTSEAPALPVQGVVPYVTSVNGETGEVTVTGGTGGSTLVQVGTLTLPAAPAVGESVTVLADSTTTLPATVTWDTGGAPTVTDRLLISLVWSGDDWVGTYGPSIPAYVAPPVEVTAAGPTWTDDTDNGGGSWTTPAETGVTYDPASGTATPSQEVTVTATAQAGYTIVGATSWTHTFPAVPADVTAPVWSATFTLDTPTETTVVATASAMAADNIAVTGYEVTYDGTTWAAIAPTGNNFTLTGTQGTTYSTTQLRARDAAGNTSTPALSVPSYTMAASSDTTAPTAGTLASSAITSSGFTVTVSGATDETALHASPYAYSTDNGTTWTAWQAAATYNATGLTASTGYQARHKVRDAAGNETVGTAITVTTGAPAIGTLTYQGGTVIAAENVTHTYTAAPLGAASASRQVIVMLATWQSGGRTVASVTVGGIAATEDYSAFGNSSSGFHVWRATVPTGTTGDVVATFSGNCVPAIEVWTADDAVTFLGGAYVDVATAEASLSLPAAVADGFAVAGYRSRANAFTTTWGGLTERWDTGLAQPTSGGDTATTGPATVTATLSDTPSNTSHTRLGGCAYRWGA